jgi:hypothetical protein
MACPCAGQRPQREPGETQRPTLAGVLGAALGPSPARLPLHHRKVLGALMACRTPALGGHLYRCEDCGAEHFIAHSCRNRHCPACQGRAARQWLENQAAALLPVPYFHLVFTLPHALNALIAQNRRALYNLLFSCAGATLLEFGRRKLKAHIGLTAVLHTWSQTLGPHYHLHCIVTGGGPALDGQSWRGASPHYLFPVRALSIMFRAKFRDGLKQLHASGSLAFHGKLEPLRQDGVFRRLLAGALRQKWVVYAKRPFAGPAQVLAYLSRYTHRVAISNGRLLAFDRDAATLTFTYKDYRQQARRKTMTLDLSEFLRRFCLHILPERFVKIRHYGLLSNQRRKEKIEHARRLLAAAAPHLPHNPANEPLETPPPAQQSQPPASAEPAAPPRLCPQCGSAKLVFIGRRPPRRVPRLDSS